MFFSYCISDLLCFVCFSFNHIINSLFCSLLSFPDSLVSNLLFICQDKVPEARVTVEQQVEQEGGLIHVQDSNLSENIKTRTQHSQLR